MVEEFWEYCVPHRYQIVTVCLTVICAQADPDILQSQKSESVEPAPITSNSMAVNTML
jgi:hypothetical protein